MLIRLKRWLTTTRQAAKITSPQQQPAKVENTPDRWESLASRPLPLDAQLALANGRLNEQQVQAAVREGVRRFRETASNNPASLWALSFVDPYSWAMDTPDFYPGFGALGGWGVPWMLNNQGVGDALPVYINEYGLKLIRDWSRKILSFNEFALNAVENRISYIVGKGFQYTVLPKKKPITPAQTVGNETGAEPSALAAKAQAILDEFISRERWNEREQEVIKRCDRDGEAFIRFFRLGNGLACVRFVEPECVTDGKPDLRQCSKYGILSDPEDIENVTHYSIVANPQGDWVPEAVPAVEVLHVKVNTDFDAKRGLPTLFPVRKNLERADKLLRNMSVMAQVQATFAVIRKHKGFSPTSVSTYQQNQADLQTTNQVSGRTLSLQQYYPGSVIDASDKTEYEFPSANIDASGLVAVLQAELRAIASRLVMTDWMLTADSSGANVSTALVAGAPCVEKFKRDQAFFARRFGDGEYGRPEAGGGVVVGALWRVLAIAAEAGLLPPETLTDLEIQAEGPSITVINKVAETNRARTLNEAGLLSMETWGKWEGLDYQQEVSLGAKAKAPPPAPSGLGSGGLPAPPGTKDAGGLFSEALREEIRHVFGKCVDTSTHKVVACPGRSDPGGKQGAGGSSREEKEKQLAGDVKKMEETPEGKETLSRGAKIAEKVKDAIGTAAASALQALDDESQGGASYLLSSLRKKDAGGVNHAVNAITRSIFTNVYEEVFEYALAGHSFSGAHAVGVIAAKGAAVAETHLLKAVAWAWRKATTRESLTPLTEAELTGVDKAFLLHLGEIGAEAIRAVLKSAGVEDPEVDEKRLAEKIVASIFGS